MERLRNWLVSVLFEDWFAGYVFPFDRSSSLILGMPEAERVEYFRQAKELRENRVYTLEIQELIRVYYQKLAVDSKTEVERTAYRLTVKALQDLDRRIQSLAVQYHPETITNSLKRM